MSLQSVLNDEWSEYDDRKKRNGSDHSDFACTEAWEVDYLTEKIIKHHPALPPFEIRHAIAACCMAIGSPRPRQVYVECVMKRLDIA